MEDLSRIEFFTNVNSHIGVKIRSDPFYVIIVNLYGIEALT